MADVRALLVGAGAALAVPLWLDGSRWTKLLGSSPEPAPEGAGFSLAVAEEATRVALRGLGVLSRLPGGLWRSTCLYRSVAECLVLRVYGVDARLRIGVGREDDGEAILAHAWVVLPGERDEAADPRAGTLQTFEVRT